MRTLNLFILINLISIANFNGQNLVINPSFEEMEFCPVDFTSLNLQSVKNWRQAGDGTPDYFNRCSKKVGIPENIFGNQEARTGNGYVGLGTYLNNNMRYREYIVGRLTRALKPGEQVCITLYYSAADFCQFVHDGFGVVLSAKPIAQKSSKTINVSQESMSNPRFNMMDDFIGWSELSTIFTAQGGEEVITIGNFKDEKDMRLIHRTKDSKMASIRDYAYIYIDDLSIIPIQKKSDCSCINEQLAEIATDPPRELTEYDEIKLDAIHFDFDQFTLTDSAVQQLKDIYTLLRKNKHMYMEILGHTDNVGGMEYNQLLSEQRAQSVIQFLTLKGIESNRFTIIAKGMSEPAKSNETEEGRAYNRRVEFQIRQKRFELVK
jgi:outer membrane protein OmpA-like peptidoglycan-associated protein